VEHVLGSKMSFLYYHTPNKTKAFCINFQANFIRNQMGLHEQYSHLWFVIEYHAYTIQQANMGSFLLHFLNLF
jgi:hypothetical protein